jgi:hypothetical protein
MAHKKRPDGFPKMTLKNIRRPEPKYFGWRVNIKRGRKAHWRDFPDGPDGPFESLRAAILWRNMMWLRLGPPNRVSVSKRNARNSSGVVGVSREVQRTPSSQIFEVWAAGWNDADRINHRRVFSIDKYGDADAKHRAIAARLAGLAAADKERRRRWAELLYMQNRMLRGG